MGNSGIAGEVEGLVLASEVLILTVGLGVEFMGYCVGELSCDGVDVGVVTGAVDGVGEAVG